MKCSRCQREIKKPAATSGKLTLGPTCARLMGLGPVPRLAERSRTKCRHCGEMTEISRA